MHEKHWIENCDTAVSREESVYQNIDRKSPEILAALAAAPIFKKCATVMARPAIPGEAVITALKDGREETTNVAKDGDFVVANPSGEQYILTADNFLQRYIPTDEAGVYAANGYVRAIKNPLGFPIEILASWGKPQYGNEECLIADFCDREGNNMGGEPYIIDAEAFNETYKPSTD